MLQFGKYKGKNLSNIAKLDYPYIVWIANTIPNLKERLDLKDYQFINMLIHPIEYIKRTYKEFNTLRDDEILQILKNEGLLYTAYQYIGKDGVCYYTIETIYGSRYGSKSNISPFVTSDGVNLSKEVLLLMEKYAKKHFHKFY